MTTQTNVPGSVLLRKAYEAMARMKSKKEILDLSGSATTLPTKGVPPFSRALSFEVVQDTLIIGRFVVALAEARTGAHPDAGAVELAAFTVRGTRTPMPTEIFERLNADERPDSVLVSDDEGTITARAASRFGTILLQARVGIELEALKKEHASTDSSVRWGYDERRGIDIIEYRLLRAFPVAMRG